MRLSAIIKIAREYFLVGIILVAMVAILFWVGYFIVYKGLLKGSKTLKLRKLSLYAMLLIYIVIVLGATLGTRIPRYGGGGVNMHLFSSYKEAWNSFSVVEWRNIILNILMFTPLGFLLPLIFNKCETWWVTYFVGFLSTVFLELIQLVTGMGVFDLDDIWNNTLGVMIGYGILMICISYFRHKKKHVKSSVVTLTYLQIPLCVTVVVFIVIFASYANQELGNLSVACSYSQDISNITAKVKFDDTPDSSYVYKSVVGSKEDTLKVANEILRAVNTEVDESKNDVYDETIFYHSRNEEYSVLVDYLGLTTRYVAFTKGGSSGKEGLSYKEVKKLLSSFAIELPAEADFTDKGKGAYEISINMLSLGDIYLDGILTCDISNDGIVSRFTNKIMSYIKYKEYEIISEKEAYDKVLQGKFKVYSLGEKPEIQIIDVHLIYKIDSKGFYQPVYEFILEGTDSKENILVPALKL
ncbi:MAG: VanZ family protein [Clostridium sp.]|uniref:VanZ family protein n=1 Tax=Clostridium sp. TaxID=1506 RepID=UPI003049D0A3